MIGENLLSPEIEDKNENPYLSYALDYASRGWPVVPMHSPQGDGSCSCGKDDCPNVGKHPRIRDWINEATMDQARQSQSGGPDGQMRT